MSDLPVNIDSTYADDAGQTDVQIHQAHHDALHTLYNMLAGAADPTPLANKLLEALLAADDIADLQGADGADGADGAPGPGSGVVLVWTPWDAAQGDGDFEPDTLKDAAEHKTFVYPAGIDALAVTGVEPHDGDYFDEITIT